MSGEIYEGPVTYQDGWHLTVVSDGEGHDAPGVKLVTDGDGVYRYATDDDTLSHHDRFHEKFVTVEMEDGKPALRVTPEELEDVKAFLAKQREGGEG